MSREQEGGGQCVDVDLAFAKVHLSPEALPSRSTIDAVDADVLRNVGVVLEAVRSSERKAKAVPRKSKFRGVHYKSKRNKYHMEVERTFVEACNNQLEAAFYHDKYVFALLATCRRRRMPQAPRLGGGG